MNTMITIAIIVVACIFWRQVLQIIRTMFKI